MKKMRVFLIWRALMVVTFCEDQCVDAIRYAFDERNKARLHSEQERRIRLDGRVLKSSFIPSDLLPREKESYTPFIERCFAGMDAKTLMLVLHNCHTYAPSAYKSARSFLAPLVEKLGAPSVMVGLDMFVGKYLSRREMLHKDTGMVFMFPLINHKSMLVWPWEYFADQAPDSEFVNCNLHWVNFEDHLQEAKILTGRPGQALYWPSKWWHMANTRDLTPTLTMNVTWYMASTIRELISPVIEKALRNPGLSKRIDQLPVQLNGDIKLGDIILPNEVNDFMTGLETVLKYFCIQRDTSAGFANVPRVIEAVTGKKISLSDPKFKIVKVLEPNGAMGVVFDGKTIRFPTAGTVSIVIDALNSGEIFDMSIKENAPYEKIMNELAKVGAVRASE